MTVHFLDEWIILAFPMQAWAATAGGSREVLKLALPLIVSTASFSAMQFVDRVFLARYSAEAIQAALPAGLLAFTFCSFFMALAGYTNTFVAQYYGAGDKTACARATAQGIWLAIFSWPLILALIPVGWLVLRFSGHPPAVVSLEREYFTILMAGGLHIPLGAAISGFFTGKGDTTTNMVAQVLGNAVNIVLDYALIFGRWGFPEWGVRGAAIATVCAGFVPPLLLGVLYVGPRLHGEYRTRDYWRLECGLFWRLWRFGFPAGLHMVLDVASFTVFVLLTGRLGALPLAVSNIALSINNLAFMPLLGISIAASILVGQYQGRRDSENAERAGWSALRVGLAYMSFIGLTYALFPRAYFELFAARAGAGFSMDELLAKGRWLLLLMAFWGFFDAVNLVIAGALKGAGDTRFVMWYSVGIAWGIFVPGSWYVVDRQLGGIVGAWAFLAAVVVMLAVGFLARFVGGMWKRIELI